MGMFVFAAKVFLRSAHAVFYFCNLPFAAVAKFLYAAIMCPWALLLVTICIWLCGCGTAWGGFGNF